jgi:pimeloyl-ACP methyl ester carboxylesterase
MAALSTARGGPHLVDDLGSWHTARPGRPLILLHGFMDIESHWLDQGPADTLTKQGFWLVLPDFRGHGKSARCRAPKTRRWARATVEFTDTSQTIRPAASARA